MNINKQAWTSEKKSACDHISHPFSAVLSCCCINAQYISHFETFPRHPQKKGLTISVQMNERFEYQQKMLCWTRERTYLPTNVEDKTRFVFNDVFSRVLFKQLFLPIHDKIMNKYAPLNSSVLELSLGSFFRELFFFSWPFFFMRLKKQLQLKRHVENT